MKLPKVLFVICIFCSANSISAQYGNGYGNSGYGNGYGGSGMNRNMQAGAGPDSHEPSKEDIEKSKAEGVKKIVDNLNKELKLDELQLIAIKNIYTEAVNTQQILIKSETSSQEEKVKQVQALSEATEMKVQNLLYKEQKAKFRELTEKKKNEMEKSMRKRN